MFLFLITIIILLLNLLNRFGLVDRLAFLFVYRRRRRRRWLRADSKFKSSPEGMAWEEGGVGWMGVEWEVGKGVAYF